MVKIIVISPNIRLTGNCDNSDNCDNSFSRKTSMLIPRFTASLVDFLKKCNTFKLCPMFQIFVKIKI